MRYLTVEPAGRIEHGAVGRRDGVWRGSGVSHVTAAAGAAAASIPASAADPDDIVIAPVHPAYRREGDVSSFILSHASKRTILSRVAPSPHTSADPRSEILHPFLLEQPPVFTGVSCRIASCRINVSQATPPQTHHANRICGERAINGSPSLA